MNTDIQNFLEYHGIKVSTHKVVCHTCHGEGTTVNPSVDGFSLHEADPEFVENYFGGVYDIVCPECKGNNVVDEPDLGQLTPEQSKELEYWLQGCAEDRALEAAERRAGC